MSEQQVQNKIYSLLKSYEMRVGTEISVLNRCIDIVYSNEKAEIITIEVKLRDWRKAVQQALDHKLYADKSYICLPKPETNPSAELMGLLRKTGIGLFWFELQKTGGGEIEIEERIKAKKNRFRWAPGRKKIESMLYA